MAYTLDDPRPIAAENPYTYWLPSPEELAALVPGDLVKLIFRPMDGGRRWSAERMWVTIERADGDRLEGRLENEPEDIPGLAYGEAIGFERHQVIDLKWAEDRTAEPPAPAPRRGYWDRCLVDRCVREKRTLVHYLYREAPELAQPGDEFPDSGWRIRGDYRGLGDEEINHRAVEYVALGTVLNIDDSWIDLIDAPVGSAFIRDWTSGIFVAEDRNR